MCVIANLAQLPFAQKCLGIVGIYDKININQVSQPTFGEYDIAVYDAIYEVLLHHHTHGNLD